MDRTEQELSIEELRKVTNTELPEGRLIKTKEGYTLEVKYKGKNLEEVWQDYSGQGRSVRSANHIQETDFWEGNWWS